MIRRSLFTLAALLLTTLGGAQVVQAPNASILLDGGSPLLNPGVAGGPLTKLAYTGTLTTSGSSFSNGTNQGMLIGANSSGFETVAAQGYSPQDPFGSQAGLVGGPNYTAMGGSSWKMNFLRLPFNEASMMQRITWDANNQVNVTDPGGNYRTAYSTAITNAQAAGMYVSVDMHWTMAGGGTPLSQDVMANTENSIAAWQYVANTYGYPNGTSANPGVAFELFNEPNLPGQGGTITGPTGSTGSGTNTTTIVDPTPQTWATNMWTACTVKNNTTAQTSSISASGASSLTVSGMTSNASGQTYTLTCPSPYSQIIAQGGTGTRVNYNANGGAFNQARILQLSAAPTVNSFFPGDTITQGATTAKVYGFDHVNNKIFYNGSVTGFTTGTVTKTAGSTAPPIIGRTATPHTITTGYPATNLNSSNYAVQWRSGVGTISTGNPAWADLDLSAVISTSTRTIMMCWYNEATIFDAQAVGGQSYYNNPQNYTVQMNTASGNPSTGWTIIATVNGWFLNSNCHLISTGGGSSIGGTYWKSLRMNVTSIMGSSGNTDVNIKMDVWDVTNGLQGAILFVGDSITSNTLQHQNPAGNFGDLALANGGYYSVNVPLSINAGIFGYGVTSAASGNYLTLLQSTNPSISLSNLIPNFPGQLVTINLGVNDEAGGTGNISTYTANMETIIGIIQAAGKIPIIPTITFNTAYPSATTTAYNAAITGTLQALPGVLAGPDLYHFTNGYNGTLAGATQSTTQAEDTAQSWAPNSYTGCTFTNTATTGTATVTSNTTNTLTFTAGMSTGTNTAGNAYNLNCQILITSNDGLHPNAQGVKDYMLVWAWWASQNLSNAATATVSNATGTFGIAGYQQIINAIRATSATNTILIGMNDYSDRVADWLPNLITDPKPAGYVGTWVSHIAAARHPYYSVQQTQSATVAGGGSGYKGLTGTVTAGTTGNPCTLEDTSQSWTTNQWAGSFAYSSNSPYKVVSNTANTLTMTDAIGNSCWGAPSGTYYLGDRLIMGNGSNVNTYFPSWFLVNGVSGTAITSVYAQMPGEDPNGLGGTVGRGGLYNQYNSTGSVIPSNPMSQDSTSGSGSGATFTVSFSFKTGAPDSNPTSRTYESAILAAGYPVIYTEFGDWSQPGATQAPWIGASTGLLAWADSVGISSCGWTWDLFGYQYMFNSLITNSGGTASPGYGTVFQTYSTTHLQIIPALPIFGIRRLARGRRRRRARIAQREAA